MKAPGKKQKGHGRTLTCLSSNSTFLVSSMRFLLTYLMAVMFAWKRDISHISFSLIAVVSFSKELKKD